MKFFIYNLITLEKRIQFNTVGGADAINVIRSAEDASSTGAHVFYEEAYTEVCDRIKT